MRFFETKLQVITIFLQVFVLQICLSITKKYPCSRNRVTLFICIEGPLKYEDLSKSGMFYKHLQKEM